MKRSKLLLVVCSVGLAGVLAYLASGQQPKPPSPTPVSLSVITHVHGVIDNERHTHGFILWSDGTVSRKSLPSTYHTPSAPR